MEFPLPFVGVSFATVSRSSYVNEKLVSYNFPFSRPPFLVSLKYFSHSRYHEQFTVAGSLSLCDRTFCSQYQRPLHHYKPLCLLSDNNRKWFSVGRFLPWNEGFQLTTTDNHFRRRKAYKPLCLLSDNSRKWFFCGAFSSMERSTPTDNNRKTFPAFHVLSH